MKARKRSWAGEDNDGDVSIPAPKRPSLDLNSEQEYGSRLNNNYTSEVKGDSNHCSVDQQHMPSTSVDVHSQPQHCSQCNGFSFPQDIGTVSACHSFEASQSSSQQVFVFRPCDNSDTSTDHMTQGVAQTSCSDMTYEPELSSQDNPHYYRINQLLFNAHREKVIRSSSCSVSGFK